MNLRCFSKLGLICIKFLFKEMFVTNATIKSYSSLLTGSMLINSLLWLNPNFTFGNMSFWRYKLPLNTDPTVVNLRFRSLLHINVSIDTRVQLLLSIHDYKIGTKSSLKLFHKYGSLKYFFFRILGFQNCSTQAYNH